MRIRIAVVASVLALASLCVFAQQVNTDFDPKADFAAFKTYAWTTGTPSPNPLGETRIHDAVNQRLQAKGMKLVTEKPDVFVATHVVTKEQKELNTMGYGGGWRFGGGMATTSVTTYVQGTLAVDLYSAQTKGLVWRGVGTDTASDKADKNAEKVNKALDKMFKNFPPKAKK
jgi:hypothetical protein